MAFRAILVDDEPLARDYLRSLLGETEDFKVVAEAGDGPTAVTLLANTAADVLFLDVQMPGMTGLEVLDRLKPNEIPAVVFVTAYDQYAIKAFDLHAVDYLLKPFDDHRFATMLDRLRSRLGDKQQEPNPSQPDLQALLDDLKASLQETGAKFVTRIPVRVSDRVIIVKVKKIDWIEATDYYATIHADGREYLLRESLTRLERQLDPARFVRIHRGAIVNIDRIAELRAIGSGEFQVVAGDGRALRLSRRRKAALEQALGRSI